MGMVYKIALTVVVVLGLLVSGTAQLEVSVGTKLHADTPLLIGQLRWHPVAAQGGLGFSFLRLAEGRVSALWYSGHVKFYPWEDVLIMPYLGAGTVGFALHLSYLGEELGRATGRAGELILGGETEVDVLTLPLQVFAGIGWTFSSAMSFEFLDEGFAGRHLGEGLGSYHVGFRVDF